MKTLTKPTDPNLFDITSIKDEISDNISAVLWTTYEIDENNIKQMTDVIWFEVESEEEGQTIENFLNNIPLGTQVILDGSEIG